MVNPDNKKSIVNQGYKINWSGGFLEHTKKLAEKLKRNQKIVDFYQIK